MSAVSPFALEPNEAARTAHWIALTLRRAYAARAEQNHQYAQFLTLGCARVLRSMRAHGEAHGYSVDLLMADAIALVEAATAEIGELA